MSQNKIFYLFIIAAATVLVATAANDAREEVESDADELARLATHSFREEEDMLQTCWKMGEWFKLSVQLDEAEAKIVIEVPDNFEEEIKKKKALEEADRCAIKWKEDGKARIADICEVLKRPRVRKSRREFHEYRDTVSHLDEALDVDVCNLEVYREIKGIMSTTALVFIAFSIIVVSLTIMSTNVEDKIKLENLWNKIASVFLVATIVMLALSLFLRIRHTDMPPIREAHPWLSSSWGIILSEGTN